MNNTKRKLVLFLLIFSSLFANSEELSDTILLDIYDVVVTGTRYKTDVRHLPMTISVLGQEKLTANYQSNVLPTVSQQIPGLFVTSRGILGYGVSTGAAGGIKVRGIGSNADLLVLVDGLPQYAGLYGHPIADAYQTMLAEKVEVLRGPASMIYGSNAMGGVVNIVTRQMQQNGVNTNVNLQGGSYGTFEGSVTNRVRSGKFSSIVGLNYGRTDGHRANSEFEQYSGFVKLGYDFSKYWNLSGDVNITYFDSSNPGEKSAPMFDNDMKITRGLAAVSLTNDYGFTSGAFRAYYNWGHHKINDGYKTGGTPRTAYYMHDDRMGGFSLYQSAQLFAGNRTTAGVDFQHFGGHAWNESIADGTTTSEIADRSVNEIAGYIDFRQNLTSWMILNAGIRLDHHSVSGSEWIPQGGFTFLLPNSATLRATVSKGFRNATLRELYMYKPANEDLEPQRLMNYELSYRQHLLDNRLMIGANVFYLKADNLIENRMVNGSPLNVNTGVTENSGFELESAWSIDNHFSVNANYSFLHMSKHQLAAPEHKAFLGGTYQSGGFRLNTCFQYVAGLYTATGANEQKEDYLLWNLTANYRVVTGVDLFVKGQNLLAQKYEIVVGFPMPRATFMGGINWSF
ncbi:TonB-dependent receptor plug domain-containing protein [Bacteroides caccae]|jgi:outer membrane cobalamin receptor|uniref:TonB-dependent receptor plug domain-containing protein n=1 Tax=Bacteroides caccae TaxID=47678 RepID=UPI0032199E2E